MRNPERFVKPKTSAHSTSSISCCVALHPKIEVDQFVFLSVSLLPRGRFFKKCFKLVCLAEYLLDDMKTYHYLSNTYVAIQGIEEVEEYNNTIKAMHIMGMSNEDIICRPTFVLFVSTICKWFILHLYTFN